MIGPDIFLSACDDPALHIWRASLPQQLARAFTEQSHGDLPAWQAALNDLPAFNASSIDLRDGVRIGCREDLDTPAHERLTATLHRLHPWRKGPIELFGVQIDTEWRSDWKWRRLIPHIRPLHDRLVLDVGCGNGYYGLRMLGAGARRVIGIDPAWLFVIQHQALRRYLPELPLHVLPLGIDDLPANLQAFDTVFSMGVLYHRHSPLQHLAQLRGALRRGGELVLETLVVEGDGQTVLLPAGRYARMRNVWFIPSCAALEVWLKRAGFQDIRCVDVSVTTTDEQRRTEWMQFESLANALDPNDLSLTVEGHPAPTRAIFTATAL